MVIKNFKNWVNEDFAQVGVAPAGNVVGMGDVVAPSGSNVGSGDAWPSLADPFSLVPLKKKKKKKKKTKKKINESHEWVDDESSAIGFFLLLAKSGVESIDTLEWGDDFYSYYQSIDVPVVTSIYMKPGMSEMNSLRELFMTGKYDFQNFVCLIEDGEFLYDDEEEELTHVELNNEWELLSEGTLDFDGEEFLDSIFYKEFPPEIKNKLYHQFLPRYLRTEGKDLNNEIYLYLFKFLTPEEQHKLRGTSTGKKFNL